MTVDMPTPTPALPAAGSRCRAEWLRLLARAPADALASLAAPLLADYRFERLRAPEEGLVMVRARIGNSGDRYNLGEVTVTRCVVRHRAPDGTVTAGFGHVLGLDAERAERVAQLDALLQQPAAQMLLWPMVIEPLRALVDERQQAERAQARSSRVRFFTLQAEA
jgi:alpha-D-ribose 1-methylphosphonate 5-triphosphate synthase subunit PhnG